MTVLHRLGLTAVSVLLGLGMAALSRVPYEPAGADDAMIRLSWRLRAEPVTTCRPLSDEERVRLPVHMQRDTVCTGGIPPHRLRVEIDGRSLEDALVVAGGAREDRPLAVFREFRVPPGPHDVLVEFRPEAGSGADGDGLGPTRFPVVLEEGEVTLLTVDARSGRLVRRP